MNFRNAYPLESQADVWKYFKVSIQPCLSNKKKEARERVWKQKLRERERDAFMEWGEEGKKREISERPLSKILFKGKMVWSFHISMHAVGFGPVYFSFPPHHGSWLVHEHPLMHGPLCVEGCAPKPAARSWLEFITGATSLWPGYAEKQGLKAGLILFFGLSCVFFVEHVLLLCSWRKQNK